MMTSRLSEQDNTLYLYLNIDQFPAQAIAAYNFRLQKQPFVVIRQNSDSHKSLIWACSPATRELAIKRGTPLQDLKKRKIDVQVLLQDKKTERAVISELETVFSSFTPEYTIKSNGNGLLDFTNTPIINQLSQGDIALKLKNEILNKVNLQEVSIGISRSKLIARILTRLAGPNEIKVCEPGTEHSLLMFLDTRYLPGLSRLSREKLKKYGLKKVGQLMHLSKSDLKVRFGNESDKLLALVQGIDAAFRKGKNQVITAETVFYKDINCESTISHYICYTADKFCHRLQSADLQTKKVVFILQYADSKVTQKIVTFEKATSDINIISTEAVSVFKKLYQRRVAIKSLKIQTRNPAPQSKQLLLFEHPVEKKKRLFQKGITGIRKKYSFNSLFRAGDLKIMQNKKEKPAKKSFYNKNHHNIKPESQTELSGHKIYIGTAVSSFNSRGNVQFAANDTKSVSVAAEMSLNEYQRFFPVAEIQHSFFHEPLIKEFLKIERQSKENMLYSIRIQKKICQPKVRDLQNATDLFKKQIIAVSPLVETGRFFCFLFQLAADECRTQEMLDYILKLTAIPVSNSLDVNIEFRHPSWYSEYVFSTLKDNGIGICNSEVQNKNAFPFSTLATTEKGYIRYNRIFSPPVKNKNLSMVQNQDEYYSIDEMEFFISAQQKLQKKVSSMAVIFNNQPLCSAYINANQNIRLFNRSLKTRNN